MDEKIYRGERDPRGFVDQGTLSVIENGAFHRLDPRLDLFNHSPTGFEWGYGGSGPAQLALAILADATGDDEVAVRLHQQYKREVIATLDPRGPMRITGSSVRVWLARQATTVV